MLEEANAQRRALANLRKHLNADQLRDLSETGWFSVQGFSGRWYRVRATTSATPRIESYLIDSRGNARNVWLYDPRNYTSVGYRGYPPADHALGLLLYLSASATEANAADIGCGGGRFERPHAYKKSA